MKIASWNVNSVKARLPGVLQWLEKASPDIVLLQELKGLEFPEGAFAEKGFNARFVSEKSYNGVAVLAKQDISLVSESLSGGSEDPQARYMEADIAGLRVINVYVPNGNPCPGEKFDYKLQWLERLYERFKELRARRVPFFAGGDFNIIPEDRDCYDAELWRDDALFRAEVRERLRSFLNLGMYDAFRLFNRDDGQYTFWDYQGGAFRRDQGIRIDHFLCSPAVTDRLKSCYIDREPRSADKPSDHTPILMELQ